MSKTLANALRKAIRDSGHSANKLAQATGVPQTTLSRFLRGENIGLSHASAIADYLGLKLRAD